MESSRVDIGWVEYTGAEGEGSCAFGRGRVVGPEGFELEPRCGRLSPQAKS